MGRVARLSNCRSHTAARAPSFAYFAKGGYDDDIHNGRCRTDKSCAGSIAAHPFDRAQGRLLQKTQGWDTLRGNGAMQRRATCAGLRASVPSLRIEMWPSLSTRVIWSFRRL
jgi:hypothetical protein